MMVHVFDIKSVNLVISITWYCYNYFIEVINITKNSAV